MAGKKKKVREQDIRRRCMQAGRDDGWVLRFVGTGMAHVEKVMEPGKENGV